MTEREVTPEMVREVIACTPERAEKVAAYANHRLAGLLPTDARRETGIVLVQGGGYYEKCLTILCGHFDLMEPRKARPIWPVETPGRPERAGVAGAHQTNHVQRGITDPGCPHCEGGGHR